MIKASIDLQELRRKIYLKAKAEPAVLGSTKRSVSSVAADSFVSPSTNSVSSLIGLISDEAKPSGKRSAGKPHAAFEEAGSGNVSYGRNRIPLHNRKGEDRSLPA